MCFRITTEAKIAKEDIKCWKMVNSDLTNAFSQWIGAKIQYVKNERMPEIKLQKSPYEDIINEGYHSFKGRSRRSEIDSGWMIDNRYDTIIKHFIIPKGTRYYENDEQYVSETIILID